MIPAKPPPRPARLIAYTLFGLAGLAAVLWPAPSVRAASGWLVYVWAAWLLVGGLTSAVGTVTDRWIGEYAGLPLLVAAFGVYALVVGASGRLPSVAGALVLGGLAAKLAARWQDVHCVRREATALARAKRQR